MSAVHSGKLNLLQVYNRDPWLVAVSTFFMLTTLITPAAVTVDLVAGRFSPLLLHHHFAEFSETGKRIFDLTYPEVWIISFVDWIFFYAGVLYVFSMLAFAFETMKQISPALRTLRYGVIIEFIP